MTTQVIEKNELSTFKQNRYIYHYLGLDIRDCNPSLSIKDAADCIGQMKSDPKFVYDYLVNHNAKIVDSTKVEKLILKEKVVKVKAKTKTQMCKDLYSKNNKLTTKQIANQVGCDHAVAWRALNGSKKNLKKTKSSFEITGLSEYVKSKFIDSDDDFNLETLAKSYNTEHKTKFTINQFGDGVKELVKHNFISKIGKGMYSKYTNHRSKAAPACADKFIVKRISSGRLSFRLNDATKSYPDIDSRKIKKAIQNWSYSNRVVHGHKIESSGYGKYSLVKVDGSVSIPASKPASKHVKTKVDVEDSALQIAASLYKMVGMDNAIKYIKWIENIKNG
jgi:hypothetical protein